MIVSLILDLIFGLLSLLLMPFKLPPFPESVDGYLTDFIGYVEQGRAFINNFIVADLVNVLLGLFIALLLFKVGYKFVMFILRKIPMLGIE